jgi:hypothetical protein
MKNDKHIMKVKLPRLTILHKAWVCIKWLILIGLLITAVWALVNSGAGVFITAIVFFLLIRSLVRLTFRLIVTIVYVLLLLLILGLIIL